MYTIDYNINKLNKNKKKNWIIYWCTGVLNSPLFSFFKLTSMICVPPPKDPLNDNLAQWSELYLLNTIMTPCGYNNRSWNSYLDIISNLTCYYAKLAFRRLGNPLIATLLHTSQKHTTLKSKMFKSFIVYTFQCTKITDYKTCIYIVNT